jgi:hypothetical protein
MLILPLDYPEPFAATLGVMLYPAIDEVARARAFAAQYLAKPIQLFHEAGHTLPYDALARIAIDAGQPLTDHDARWWGGSAVGETFKTFFALANADPRLASWSNAVWIAEKVAGRHSGARTFLYEARRRFWSVAHLWGAWSIRKGQFVHHPEVGYDGVADFQSFLAEGEILRRWGQEWQPLRRNSDPPLPPDVWRVPVDWEPPVRQPGWPKTGMIPHLTISEELLAELRLLPH